MNKQDFVASSREVVLASNLRIALLESSRSCCRFCRDRRLGGLPGGLLMERPFWLLPDYRHLQPDDHERCHMHRRDASFCFLSTLNLLPAELGGLAHSLSVISALAALDPSAALSAAFAVSSPRHPTSPRRRSLSNGMIFALPILFFASFRMFCNFQRLRFAFPVWLPVLVPRSL